MIYVIKIMCFVGGGVCVVIGDETKLPWNNNDDKQLTSKQKTTFSQQAIEETFMTRCFLFVCTSTNIGAIPKPNKMKIHLLRWAAPFKFLTPLWKILGKCTTTGECNIQIHLPPL